MDALWEASQGLTGVDLVQETNEPPLPHPPIMRLVQLF